MGALPVSEARVTQPRSLNALWASFAEACILLMIVCVFSALNPGVFLTIINLNTILNNAAIPLVIGVGGTFVVLMGRIDLSVEGIMGASGMAFVLLSANSRNATDLGIWAYPAAVGLGAVLGAVSGLIHTRLKVPSFIVSLGMWYIGMGIANELFGVEMIPFLSNSAAVAWPTQTPFGIPNSFFWPSLWLLSACYCKPIRNLDPIPLPLEAMNRWRCLMAFLWRTIAFTYSPFCWRLLGTGRHHGKPCTGRRCGQCWHGFLIPHIGRHCDRRHTAER